jgi:predicted transcriptional regulator
VKRSKAIAETAKAVVEATTGDKDGSTVKAIAEKLDLDMSAAYRRLKVAEDAGVVVNLEERPHRPGRYELSGSGMVEANLLPTAEELHARIRKNKEARQTKEAARQAKESERQAKKAKAG